MKTPLEIDSYQQLQVYAMRKNVSYYLYQLDMEIWQFQFFVNEWGRIQQLTKNKNGTNKSHYSSTNGIYGGRANDLKIKIKIKNEKENTYKHIMEHLKDNMSEKSKRLLQLSTENNGVSNWPTMLSIAEYGFELSKH